MLVAFWLWMMARRREHPIGALIPWFSAVRRRAVVEDLGLLLVAVRALRLPVPGTETPLASAAHGAGLLLAALMATTGAAAFLGPRNDGFLPAVADAALGVHELAAKLMWAYLIGHPALALLHEAFGSRIFNRMFWGARLRWERVR